MKLYIDTNDWWVGYYRGETHHYVCLLPTVVIRWNRKSKPLPTFRDEGYGTPRLKLNPGDNAVVRFIGEPPVPVYKHLDGTVGPYSQDDASPIGFTTPLQPGAVPATVES